MRPLTSLLYIAARQASGETCRRQLPLQMLATVLRLWLRSSEKAAAPLVSFSVHRDLRIGCIAGSIRLSACGPRRAFHDFPWRTPASRTGGVQLWDADEHMSAVLKGHKHDRNSETSVDPGWGSGTHRGYAGRGRSAAGAEPAWTGRYAHDAWRQREPGAMECDAEGDGAAYRTRTCDPRITNAMLYQLS